MDILDILDSICIRVNQPPIYHTLCDCTMVTTIVPIPRKPDADTDTDTCTGCGGVIRTFKVTEGPFMDEVNGRPALLNGIKPVTPE